MVDVTTKTMPKGEPAKCDASCANAVTSYIKNTLLANVVTPSSSSKGASSSAPAVGVGATPLERGRDLYFKDLGVGSCASCHGNDGKGVAGKGGPVIACKSCGTPSALVAQIDATMPAAGANLCVGTCATEVATYIYEHFNGKNFTVSCDEGIQKASAMRRLNKTEIANAVTDVFGLGQGKITTTLPNEQEVIGGFATVGSALTTSRDWTDALLNAAVDVADVVVDGGKFPVCAISSTSSVGLVDTQPKTGECATTAQCRTLYAGATDCSNAAGGVCYCGTKACSLGTTPTPTPNTDCYASAVKEVGKLLFRRSLTAAELTQLATLRNTAKTATGIAKDGDKAVVIALLTSPKFIFSLAADKKTTARSLTGKELADRLALTLWGSVPDAALIDAAANNQLKDAVLEQHIDRMLTSPKFDRFASVFVDPWIGLGGYNLTGKDTGLTDTAWNSLLEDMKTETRLFVAHIIKNNLPVNELYTANYSFMNARLQKHYGLNVSTTDAAFVKTSYPANSSRRGLMTQAAVLAKAFDGTKTSVVKRGVLPLEAFTCTAPEPPTNNPDIADAVNNQANSNASEKDKVASRAANSACASCHAVIDPLGWVFTEFGNAGETIMRDPDGDALNTAGNLFGQNFSNAHSMMSVLVEEDQFASCFANKFLIAVVSLTSTTSNG